MEGWKRGKVGVCYSLSSIHSSNLPFSASCFHFSAAFSILPCFFTFPYFTQLHLPQVRIQRRSADTTPQGPLLESHHASILVQGYLVPRCRSGQAISLARKMSCVDMKMALPSSFSSRSRFRKSAPPFGSKPEVGSSSRTAWAFFIIAMAMPKR